MADTKRHRLKDGRELIIRAPDADGDLEAVHAFFAGLPAEARNAMHYDVRDREFLRRRLSQIDQSEHWRLIAVVDGAVVGDVTLDRNPFGWTRHIGELRCIVTPAMRKLGVGHLLCQELVSIGAAAGIERLFTEIKSEQTAAIEAAKKVGFVYESTHKNYAKDTEGKLHDVDIYSNDLSGVWNALAEHIHALDEPSCRSGEY